MQAKVAPLMNSPFMERVIRFLMPFFIDCTKDFAAARAEILDTIAGYGARTRAEMLNVAQIIAFGLSALEMLEEARTAEMSASMRLRYRSCANGLNRACQQNEKALARRLACDAPGAPTSVADVLTEDEVEQIVQEAQDTIGAYRNRLSGRPSATARAHQPAKNARPRTSPVMDVFNQHFSPAAPAAPPA